MGARLFEQLSIKFEAPDRSSAPPVAYPLTISGPGGQGRFALHLAHAADAYSQQVERLIVQPALDSALLRTIGNELYAALFSNDAAAILTNSLAMLDIGTRLRIVLEFEEAAHEIAALPWELLCDPSSNTHLALTSSLVRFPWLRRPAPIAQAARPLRVLLTAAQTGPPARLEAELNYVQNALADLGHERVDCVIEPHLTAQKLQDRLREGFHIWHFVGHGEMTTSGPRLLFEDEYGDKEPQQAADLSAILAGKGIGLVVLSACESGRLAGETLRSLPLALMQGGVPAVVAMQFKVYDDSTRAFAEEFYRSLADGKQIDYSVIEGRIRLNREMGQTRPDWCTPVLYTRSPDARLVDPPSAPGAPPLTARVLRAAETAPCANLREALTDLNFVPQGLPFRDWMRRNTRCGAFLIHGEHDSGHEWMVERLMLRQKIAVGKRFDLNLGRISRPKTTPDLWADIELQLNLTPWTGAADAFDERAKYCGVAAGEILREKSLLLVFDRLEVVAARPDTLQSLIDELWRPLALEATKSAGQGYVILFLLARKECGAAWPGVVTDQFNPAAPLQPVRLPALPERLSNMELEYWWQRNLERLPPALDEYSPQDWLQDSEDGKPQLVIEMLESACQDFAREALARQ